MGAWEDRRRQTPEAAAADVTAFCATHDRWVVEGCYAALVGHTIAYSPLLLFIDPGMDACLAHCRNRPWEPHKYASKAEQDAKLEFLLTWVRGYYTRDDDLSLSAHRTLFESYHGLKLRLAHHQTTWLDDLAGRFQGCAIPAKEWTHAAHLVVGLWHVHRYGAMDALVRLRAGIRRLNESHGGVNSTTNGYHETITAAYVQLLTQYLDRHGTDMPLDIAGARSSGRAARSSRRAVYVLFTRSFDVHEREARMARAGPCADQPLGRDGRRAPAI